MIRGPWKPLYVMGVPFIKIILLLVLLVLLLYLLLVNIKQGEQV